jgi:hypothetical protein
MTSRLPGSGLVAALLTGVALNLVPATPVRADIKDGDVVYCLSSAQRAGLVETAVVLRLADPVPPSVAPSADALPVVSASAPSTAPDSLESWRRGHEAAFARACAALVAAAQVPQGPRTSSGPGPVRNMVTVLLPATIGALLSWFFATQLAGRNARRVQAAALRSAKKQFDREVQSIIDERWQPRSGPPPRQDAVRAARIDLVNQLEEVAALHRGWTEPGEVGKRLEGAELAGAIEAVSDEAAAEVRTNANEMVRELMARVEAVAVAVERPLRDRDKMTSPVTAGAVP